MEIRIVPIQQLNDAQVAELAKLHQAVIHSLLSDLGFPFLEKYYRRACAEESVVGFCALSEENIPVAWVVGSPKPDQLNQHLMQPFFWFLLHMLRVAITRPFLLRQMLVSARSASATLEPDQIELTYIGVSPSARRLGIGRKLIETFIQACQSRYHSIVLSVEVENASAIRLYTTLGFQILNTLVEGTFKRQRMELKL